MTPEEVGGKEGPGAWGEGKQVGSAGLSLPAAPAACPASTLKQGLDMLDTCWSAGMETQAMVLLTFSVSQGHTHPSGSKERRAGCHPVLQRRNQARPPAQVVQTVRDQA